MSKILIDTSAWIEYFAGNPETENIDFLLEENNICTNKIILCELIPFLKEKKQTELIDLLEAVEEIPLNIKWEQIIEYQSKNIKNNYRKIGIPDLIILENLLQNNLEIYTFDKHFKMMSNLFDFEIHNNI
jgi:hypothetical protein